MVAAEKVNGRMAKKEKASRATDGKAKLNALIEDNTILKNTLSQIEKQFGEGSIMPLGGDRTLEIQGIPTGSLSLDLALGGKGIPRGRIIEIFGPESSGKTTLALHVVAQAQKLGGIAAFIDAEHAFDPSWGKKLGVQLETLLVSQPNNGEEAMQITEMLVKSNAVDVIVVDTARVELTFTGVPNRPVPSLFRGFSAPVSVSTSLSQEDRLFLARHDSDPFNRWQALQDVAGRLMIDAVHGTPWTPAQSGALAGALEALAHG